MSERAVRNLDGECVDQRSVDKDVYHDVAGHELLHSGSASYYLTALPSSLKRLRRAAERLRALIDDEFIVDIELNLFIEHARCHFGYELKRSAIVVRHFWNACLLAGGKCSNGNKGGCQNFFHSFPRMKSKDECFPREIACSFSRQPFSHRQSRKCDQIKMCYFIITRIFWSLFGGGSHPTKERAHV